MQNCKSVQDICDNSNICKLSNIHECPQSSPEEIRNFYGSFGHWLDCRRSSVPNELTADERGPDYDDLGQEGSTAMSRRTRTLAMRLRILMHAYDSTRHQQWHFHIHRLPNIVPNFTKALAQCARNDLAIKPAAHQTEGKDFEK